MMAESWLPDMSDRAASALATDAAGASPTGGVPATGADGGSTATGGATGTAGRAPTGVIGSTDPGTRTRGTDWRAIGSAPSSACPCRTACARRSARASDCSRAPTPTDRDAARRDRRSRRLRWRRRGSAGCSRPRWPPRWRPAVLAWPSWCRAVLVSSYFTNGEACVTASPTPASAPPVRSAPTTLPAASPPPSTISGETPTSPTVRTSWSRRAVRSGWLTAHGRRRTAAPRRASISPTPAARSCGSPHRATSASYTAARNLPWSTHQPSDSPTGGSAGLAGWARARASSAARHSAAAAAWRFGQSHRLVMS